MFLQGSRMKCQLPVMSNDWQLEKVTQPRCDNFHTMMAEPQSLLPADLSQVVPVQILLTAAERADCWSQTHMIHHNIQGNNFLIRH